ncbi:MAG: hypothetical protein PHP00_06880 [Thiotrichaceae bacterium]|nr:hypothetical protein [Thiotrichaceae bacterium]
MAFLDLQPDLIARVQKALPDYQVLPGASINGFLTLKSNLAPAVFVIYEGHSIKDTARAGASVAYAQLWTLIMAVRYAGDDDASLAMAQANPDIDVLLKAVNGYVPKMPFYQPLYAVTPKIPAFTAGNLFLPFSFHAVYTVST